MLIVTVTPMKRPLKYRADSGVNIAAPPSLATLLKDSSKMLKLMEKYIK